MEYLLTLQKNLFAYTNMLDKINSLKEQIEALTAANAEAIEALRIKYLSKKGEISALFNDFRNVPNEQKCEIG